MANMAILNVCILVIRITLVSSLLRPDAIHWGPMEAYTYQDKTYVRLYMTVYDTTAGNKYKDILQDENGQVVISVPVGLMWVSFGDFRRQIDFALKYKREGKSNTPLIRSFLVKADTVLEITRNSVNEEMAGSGKDLNVDQTKGYNQFGLTATSVERLRQSALSNSLVTFCSDPSYTGDTKDWGLVLPMSVLANTERQGFIYPDMEDPYTLDIVLDGNSFTDIHKTKDFVNRIEYILQYYKKETKSAEEKNELNEFYQSYADLAADKAADKTHLFEVLLPRCLKYGLWRIDMKDNWAKVQNGGQREPDNVFLEPIPAITVVFKQIDVTPLIERSMDFRIVLERRERYIASVREVASIYQLECPRVANINKDKLNELISTLPSVERFLGGTDNRISGLVQELETFVALLTPGVEQYCSTTHSNTLIEAVINGLRGIEMAPVVITVSEELLNGNVDGPVSLPLLLASKPLTIILDSALCPTTRVDDIVDYIKKSFIGTKIGDMTLEFPKGFPDGDKLRVMDELTSALRLSRFKKSYFLRSLPVDGRVYTRCSGDLTCEYRPDLRYIQVNRLGNLWFSTLILFTNGMLYEENALQKNILDRATAQKTNQFVAKFKSLNDERGLIRNALNTATNDEFTGVKVIPGVVIAPRDSKAKVVIDNDQGPSDLFSPDRARRVESLVEGSDREGSVDEQRYAGRTGSVCDGANREMAVGQRAERADSVSKAAERDQDMASRAGRSESMSNRSGRSRTP